MPYLHTCQLYHLTVSHLQQLTICRSFLCLFFHIILFIKKIIKKTTHVIQDISNKKNILCVIPWSHVCSIIPYIYLNPFPTLFLISTFQENRRNEENETVSEAERGSGSIESKSQNLVDEQEEVEEARITSYTAVSFITLTRERPGGQPAGGAHNPAVWGRGNSVERIIFW